MQSDTRNLSLSHITSLHKTLSASLGCTTSNPTMSTFTNFSGTVRPLLTDKARQPSFDEIPIISLQAPELELIDAIRDACTRVGFFYVKDHGVSQQTVEQVFVYAKKFFDIKTEEKEEVHIRKSKTMRGWDPVKEPKPESEMGVDRNGNRKQDMKETFCWGYDTSLDPDFIGEDDKCKRSPTWPRLPWFAFPLCWTLLGSVSSLYLVLIYHIYCTSPCSGGKMSPNTDAEHHSMRRRQRNGRKQHLAKVPRGLPKGHRTILRRSATSGSPTDSSTSAGS